MESKIETFNILHLSDLHVGLAGQKFLWPNIKKIFLEDLKELGERNGGWDLVIFSGDLTQKGSKEEFDRLNEYLKEIWNVFGRFNKETKLFVVPGNHDLIRLKKTSLIKSFGLWWDDKSLRDEFWKDDSNEFRVAVKDAFSNYENWLSGLHDLGIKLAFDAEGVMPGDRTGVLNAANMKIGLMGLNSAWLQLSSGDYEGQLDISLQQFYGAVDDVHTWLHGNDINLLITHHPDSWLHKDAKKCFDNEINCPGNFHAHLFGHMHDSDSITSSTAGSAFKRSIQACSLFGLEYFGNNEERMHGYSSFTLKRLDEPNKVEMTVFPRLAHLIKGKGWQIISNFNQINRESYQEVIDIKVDGASHVLEPKAEQILSALVSANEDGILDLLKYKLNRSEQHFHIRETEVKFAVGSLQSARSLWLVSDWEMGLEEFLSVVKFKLNEESVEVFKLDLSGFVNYTQFSEDSVRKIGCSFEKFCQIIAKRSSAYLILEDIPVGVENIQMDIEKEMERLLEIIIQFCESLKVILVSRIRPKNTMLGLVELRHLNEADIRAYLRAGHKGSVAESRIVDEASFIFRHTNGVPLLIDNIVKDLQVVSLDELALQKTIISPLVLSTVTAPSSLINVISDLHNSAVGLRVIAFDLLSALCVFPYGERLEVLKRFNRSINFYPDHAHLLHENGLIDFKQSSVVGAHLTSPVTLLIVKRVVREYLLSYLSDEQKHELYMKAISIYFGEYWLNGKFKINPHAKFSDTNISASIIENANELIRWFFAISLEQDDQKRISLATRLLYFYLDKLERGDHFREVANLCNTLISKVLTTRYKESIVRIKIIYAQALRMISDYERSLDVSNSLINEQKERSVLARSHMNIASCYQALGNPSLAKSHAEKVEEISKGSPIARGAKALILQLNSSTAVKVKGLKKLETESRKNNEHVNLNNIRMALAKEIDNLELRADHYKETMVSAIAHSDGYNAVRALISYSQIIQRLNRSLSDSEKRGLMHAYQFLYSQRLSYFFNACHDVLWKEFVKDGNVDNLIELFRHSSLVWRLSSNEKSELKYITSMFEFIAGFTGDKNDHGFIYLVSRSNKLNLVKGENADG